MLKITISTIEQYDESLNEFIVSKEQTLQLEHSLVSLSKWESKWNKPFITKTEKTREETIEYIKCMTITQNVDEEVYKTIPNQIIIQVNEYIDSTMTATRLPKPNSHNREIITSEIIYHWMISLNIPFECQKWHLNRLLTLINVCNIKNSPPKKMGKRDVARRNTALNEERTRSLYGKEG